MGMVSLVDHVCLLVSGWQVVEARYLRIIPVQSMTLDYSSNVHIYYDDICSFTSSLLQYM
jgi:hypothetical protein